MGVDAHFGAPVMHTGRPAHPLAWQRLAASPRGRPWRRSRFGRGGERPQGHRCPVRARGRARFHTLVPAPRVAPVHQSRAGRPPSPAFRGWSRPCAVAPSERQADPGGRRNVAAIVLDARAQGRANEPALPPEADGRSDAVGGARETGTAVGLDHAVQGTPARRPALDADEARFEHHPARPLLRLDLRGQQRQPQEQQLPHRDCPTPGWRTHRPVEAEPMARVRTRRRSAPKLRWRPTAVTPELWR